MKILHGLPGAAPAKETVPLQWKSADLLEAAIAIGGRETLLNTVEIAGQPPVTLPPVCLPYSPEFAPAQPNRGATALARIAATTGGQERIEIPKIWSGLPLKSRYVELAPWLLVAGTILFLLEILERRTGWVTRLFLRQPPTLSTPATKESADAPLQPVSTRKPVFPWLPRKPVYRRAAAGNSPVKTSAPDSAAPAGQKTPPSKPAGAENTLNALREAHERARHRTDQNRE